jgi:uncharacterized protein (DUF305 family)
MTRSELWLRPAAAALLGVIAICGGPRSVMSQGGAGRAPNYPGHFPYTQADINFVTGMISHHAQAIVMAKWAPTHGASKTVGTLCERIINAQTDEIVLMQQWLRDRKQPVPEAKPMPMKMVMDGMEHEMMMPGMLSDAQMKELDAARGKDFDQLFLLFMIQHHQGAITMVDQLFASPGAGQDEGAFKFANDIQSDQRTEIERMRQMLTSIQSGSR